MTEQEKLARQWAEEYQNDWPKFTPGTRAAELVEKAKAAAEYILANTKPETIEETGWKQSEHAIAGAVYDNGAGGTFECVMLAHDMDYIYFRRMDGTHGDDSEACFTPNGKRYRLVEDTATDHLHSLATVEDYENAPEGTIVALPDGSPWIKNGEIWKSPQYRVDSAELAAATEGARTVLRWGWGGEA